MATGGFILGAAAGTLLYYTTKQNENTAFAKQGEPALNPNSWKKFYIDSIEGVSHNTKIFHFKLETPDTPLGMPVASCILTKAPIGENGSDVIRPYSKLFIYFFFFKNQSNCILFKLLLLLLILWATLI